MPNSPQNPIGFLNTFQVVKDSRFPRWNFDYFLRTNYNPKDLYAGFLGRVPGQSSNLLGSPNPFAGFSWDKLNQPGGWSGFLANAGITYPDPKDPNTVATTRAWLDILEGNQRQAAEAAANQMANASLLQGRYGVRGGAVPQAAAQQQVLEQVTKMQGQNLRDAVEWQAQRAQMLAGLLNQMFSGAAQAYAAQLQAGTALAGQESQALAEILRAQEAERNRQWQTYLKDLEREYQEKREKPFYESAVIRAKGSSSVPTPEQMEYDKFKKWLVEEGGWTTKGYYDPRSDYNPKITRI